MKEVDFSFNVDKLELKYSVEEKKDELFNSSQIDDILRNTDEVYNQSDFTFKRRTQLNLKNSTKDKFIYYRQIFSVLYKNDYIFEIYFDPFNSEFMRGDYKRLRVLNTALYLCDFPKILESFEAEFNFNYEGYTQIDIALDIPTNIEKHLVKYLENVDTYSVLYNRNKITHYDTYTRHYVNTGEKVSTLYLRKKVNYTDTSKNDIVVYNKSREIADKKKTFLFKIISRISNGQDVYRIEIQLNEKSKFEFDRFRLTDKEYLEQVYIDKFNKMLDIRLIEHSRNGNEKKRSRCKKIDFLTELKAEAKKNASVNG